LGANVREDPAESIFKVEEEYVELQNIDSQKGIIYILTAMRSSNFRSY
jgi:hypothetical protein